MENAISHVRGEFIARVAISARKDAADAVDRLIEFSLLYPDALRLASTRDLEQPSIGFDLKGRDAMLWKAYAKGPKLEILARSIRSLAPAEQSEFRALWRTIPGKGSTLKTEREVPTIALGVVPNDQIWQPLKACLELAIRAAPPVAKERL